MSKLKDIANDAGVSVPTVSRVINTPEMVKEETRKKVQASIDKFNYSPNPAAKALVTNRTGIIDVYIPRSIDLSNPFAMYFIAGISDALSRKMYSFLIIRDRDVEHKCDGYIATGLLKNEIYEMHEYAKKRNRPLVLFGHTELPDISCVDVDNIEGTKEITMHLLNKGHRKIAMINVDEDKDYTIDRFLGYKEAMESVGESLDQNIIVNTLNNEMGGFIAMQKLLAVNAFTSVLCATDTIALGAIRAIVEAGKKVPDDISVVGFDGLGHHLLTNPHITTVQQPIFEIGRLLAESLIDRIMGNKTPKKQIVKPTLIMGKSVDNYSSKCEESH
ncbi:LacI family DNA-binding transcriptional regulator [Fusibacter bizertensis]